MGKEISIHLTIQLNHGWLPDESDDRDEPYEPPQALLSTLPASVDLRPRCPPVLNQLGLRSCTANAIANAHLFDQMKQGVARPMLPSRLFIYWNERKRLGLEGQDSGARLRGGMKVLANKGACPETEWPYDPAQVLVKPSEAAYEAARPHRALKYKRLGRAKFDVLRTCLAEGWPFVFGLSLFAEFQSPAVVASGVVPMPADGEHFVGGHAVLAVGYDDASRSFLCMNSQGPTWGQAGFFTLPWDYVTNRDWTQDFWTLREVKG